MKPTLLILAAGMGSRYGSLKQMDGIGPGGEAILDYSVFDAIRAGFGKVVFVIRDSFAKEFKELFSKERFSGKIEVDYAFQEISYLPKGFSAPEGREKPWGTNHAVMMASGIINEPFAVINADDFYGAEAFQTMGDYLSKLGDSKDRYCMVGYHLGNTLSDFGAVSRGVCGVDSDGNLTDMIERTHIERNEDGKILFKDEAGGLNPLEENTIVSMNMFGFTPDYFEYSEAIFKDFLTANSNNLKAEYYIPYATNLLIKEGKAKLKVLSSDAQWFGVTYKEDRPLVVDNLMGLIAKGKYPLNLWK